ARFAPSFAGAVIELFSRPGELVLDPYMGGGTTVVEALTRRRHVIGSDINSLAVFIARVKTTSLTKSEAAALVVWADEIVPNLSYWDTDNDDLHGYIADRRTYNLSLPRARPIKKVSALALRSLTHLPTKAARDFARCALLNVGQLFLNGRRHTGSLTRFRTML